MLKSDASPWVYFDLPKTAGLRQEEADSLTAISLHEVRAILTLVASMFVRPSKAGVFLLPGRIEIMFATS